MDGWTGTERAPVRMNQVGDVDHFGDPGGVGEQMSHGRRPEAGLGGDQPIRAQVVVGGRVEVDLALLVRLHRRSR